MTSGLCHTVFMIIFLLLSLAMYVPSLPAGVAGDQDPPKQDRAQKEAKPPKRGDTVVAKGCLKGGVLESSDLTSGSGGDYIEMTTYRLTGDKESLAEIRKDHDGHLDVITGELRTDLPKATRAAKIGNSRISVGVGPSRGMMPEPLPPMPVLKVKSFEHTGIDCR